MGSSGNNSPFGFLCLVVGTGVALVIFGIPLAILTGLSSFGKFLTGRK